MNEPKRIITEEHQRFIDVVKEETIGTFLFKFYKNYLDFGGAPTFKEKQVRKILSLSERRIRHVKSIIDKYDFVHIIKSASIIIEGIDTGKIASRIVRPGYFDKILVNKTFWDKDDESGFSYD